MSYTGIEYGDQSWNITSGCSKISRGCDNCWAKKMSKRLRGRFGYPEKRPFDPTFHENRLREPYSWRKKRNCVLVSFMGDLFHPSINIKHVCSVLEVIAECTDHTFMILTKRPERWRDIMHYSGRYIDGGSAFNMTMKAKGYLPNLWIGVSIEENKQIHRLDELLKIRAAGRFISAEPLIGPLDLSDGKLAGIDLVIVGGESGGKHSRPMHPQWVSDILYECRLQNAHFYFKQWGDWARVTYYSINNEYQTDNYIIIENPEIRTFWDGTMVARIGKKYTGHVLDNIEYQTMPPLPKKP